MILLLLYPINCDTYLTVSNKGLLAILKKLDQKLGKRERLILCGGMAVTLAYGGVRQTVDFDIIAPVPLDENLKRLVNVLAEEEGLSSDWLNDSCKGFASYLPIGWEDRLIHLNLGLKNIELFCLGKPDMLMLKLKAARDRDLQDIEVMGIAREDVEIISKNLDRIAKFDNKGALTIKLMLEELGYG